MERTKEFRIAHIVPVASLHITEDNQYHMCLAHLVKESFEYGVFYANLKDKNKGHFVLMDNGAAEGAQLDPHQLVDMYGRINPDEIVLPDTLYDGSETIQKTMNFLECYSYLPYRMMAVPQGHTLEEWLACAEVLVQESRINSFGVSKFLNIVTGDKWIRMYACRELQKLFDKYNRNDMEVHLLGCDEGPLVVGAIRDAFPFVRGCDSAFAYIATQAKQDISFSSTGRPKGEIDFLRGRNYPGLEQNITHFNWVAGVTDNGIDGSWLRKELQNERV